MVGGRRIAPSPAALSVPVIRAETLPCTESGAKQDETARPELPWTMLGRLTTPSLRVGRSPSTVF